MQHFYRAITGEPIRSFCNRVLCNEALVNVVLQIMHTYEHKHVPTSMDHLNDISPSPLLDDTTRSGEPQD